MGNVCCPEKDVESEQEEDRRYGSGECGEFQTFPSNSEEDDVCDYISENGMTPQPSKRWYRVRALYPFKALTDEDLSFEKNDQFLVTSRNLEGWLEAVHTATGKKGYIPGNYVCLDDGLPTSLDAYFNIDRIEAEKKLFMPGHEIGTYIIRPKGDGKGYALSLLVSTKENVRPVKHYVIHSSSEGNCYYISETLQFRTIKDLIEHYSVNKESLPCRFTHPCPRQYQPTIQFRDLEVDRNTIVLGHRIGKGQFGEVYKGTWNLQLTVAIKYRLATMEQSKFLEEAEIMHQLRHERLVQLLGVCTKPADQPIMIITEFMPKGDLLSFLKSLEGEQLTIKDYMLMLKQISEGMRYLEKKNFIHRDLRAVNVLVDRDNSVKVADFGLARLLQKTEVYHATTRFPVKWTAPEALFKPHKFSIKSDVWSFGIVMYEIVNPKHTIYEEIDKSPDMASLVQTGYRMPNPVPEDRNITKLYEVMKQCWAQDPADRPTFRTLYRAFCSWEFV